MSKEKIQENWRPIIGYSNYYLISDLGRIKDLTSGNFLDTSPGRIDLFKDNKALTFMVSDLVKSSFSKTDPSCFSFKHKEILDGFFCLRFNAFVPTPMSYPDIEFKGLKLWYAPDGFICVSPQRSFMQGNSKFIFPYKVGGDRAYICRFEDVQPLKYRQTRNTDKVQIFGISEPVPYRKAISIVYKRLTQAKKSKLKWIEGRTDLKVSYLNNSIFKSVGRIDPVVIYNYTVYTIFVDFKAQHAEYRELIPMNHLDKLLYFVKEEMRTDLLVDSAINWKQKMWKDTFGFSKSEFIKLVLECSKPLL